MGDCWIELIRHADRILTMESAAQSAYIQRCVTNRAIDFLRRQRNASILPYGDIECLSHLNRSFELELDMDAVLQKSEIDGIIFLLPPRERQVIHLRLSNCSTVEIARKLEITPSSARVYLARATKRLKDYIQSMDVID